MTTQINDSAKICTTNLVSDNINTTLVNIVETADKFEVRQLSGDIQKLNTSNINATATKTFVTDNNDLLYALNKTYPGVLDDIIGEASTRASVVPTIAGHTDRIQGDEDSGDLTGSLTCNKTVTWSIETQGTKSESITINEQGTWTYKPKQDANGDDSFEVKALANSGEYNIVEIRVRLIGVNDTPTTSNLLEQAYEDTPFGFSLPLATDPDLTDTIKYIITSLPDSNIGSISQDGTPITADTIPHELTSRENLLFTPIENKNGTVNFNYKVNDGTIDSEESTVTINISPVNDAPTADAVISLELTENSGDKPFTLPTATDVEEDEITFHITTLPTKGSLKHTVNGVEKSVAANDEVKRTDLKYSADLNKFGTDSFKYKIKDEHGAFSNEIQVNVTINKYLDTTPPSKPTGLANTSTEIDPTPTITGTAEAGSTVKIFNGNTQIGSGTANENGSFSITSSTTLAVGNHSLTATATDAANNTSGASDALPITISQKMTLIIHVHDSEYSDGYFTPTDPLKVYLSKLFDYFYLVDKNKLQKL